MTDLPRNHPAVDPDVDGRILPMEPPLGDCVVSRGSATMINGVQYVSEADRMEEMSRKLHEQLERDELRERPPGEQDRNLLRVQLREDLDYEPLSCEFRQAFRTLNTFVEQMNLLELNNEETRKILQNRFLTVALFFNYSEALGRTLRHRLGLGLDDEIPNQWSQRGRDKIRKIFDLPEPNPDLARRAREEERGDDPEALNGAVPLAGDIVFGGVSHATKR
ncbi:MAG: hypothetical protein AAFY06_00080 [Pseudomonadota bacterium]